jgi:2-polyprenyl-3-methyl-5-hydroxy-6-metoxy-1,4-benzoquinol methylase
MALISEDYRIQNRRLHEESEVYGSKGYKNAKAVNALVKEYPCRSVLDYGCGKGALKQALRNTELSVRNYDPAMAEFSAEPEPADLVVCADVLEHIEPDCLADVLAHLACKMKVIGLFVISCRLAEKTLPDGRNTHLIVKEPIWWLKTVGEVFDVLWSAVQPDFAELRMVVRVKQPERAE